MRALGKLLRILFLYALLFFLCTAIMVQWLKEVSNGGQLAFVFGFPAVLVWWFERYLTQRRKSRAIDRNASKVPPRRVDPSPVVSTETPRHEFGRVVSPKAPQGKGWVPAGSTASVAGRDLGGMIYVGTPPSLNTYGYRDKCRAYIDPSLTVAKTGADRQGVGLPYWPGYSEISPQCRATYLDWLAAGRSDPSYNPGYMFLYFYGIERRFFVDGASKEEKVGLLTEVRRLNSLYPDNHSVNRYLGEFIQVAEVALSGTDDFQPIFEKSGWELPLSLKIALGIRIGKGETLDADWMLSWYICHPEFHLRTPATRCPEEFRALFKLWFQARYPDGLKVSKPRRTLTAEYRAASSEFNGTITPEIDGSPVLDVSGLRKPLETIQEIVDAATADLDKYSRFLGRNPEGRGSAEAHALLPAELSSLFPSKEIEELKGWASSIVAKEGMVPVSEVIERLEGKKPEKIGMRQIKDAADALARIGFGLAPDPRYALRSPKPEEPVAIFDLGERVEKLEEVSDGYQVALMELALATFIAHADGYIADLERKSLLEQINSVEGLSEQEGRRLRANLDWFLAVPPDLGLLRRKLKDLGPEHHTAMRAALVSAAHADGVVGAEEVAGIEKIYKALGLDPNLAYSDLHAGDIDNSPRIVRAAQPGAPGEAIPAEKYATGSGLDAARIAAIRSDTERVSSVLGAIFSEADDTGEAIEEEYASAPKGLDRKHAALVRDLVQKEHWTETEFGDLCARHALLQDGALEAVNEWAFGVYDEALLDEYDGYDVAAEIADALKAEFGRENHHDETEAT